MLRFKIKWGDEVAEVELPLRVTIGGTPVEADAEVWLTPTAQEGPEEEEEGPAEEDAPPQRVEAPRPAGPPAGPPQPTVPLRGGAVAAALPPEVLREAKAAATVRDMLAPLLAAGLPPADVLALVESEHQSLRALSRVPLEVALPRLEKTLALVGAQ